MHIAVAGNIGSGKTTLTKLLAHRYGWTPRFEPVDNNPYLADFYADMPRWSFNLQIYFLSKRFKEVVEISKSEEVIIQDRTIFEDACIFAPNLHGQGMMSDRDFQNYSDLFDLMMSLVRLPDLMIYIRASIPTLVAQIQKRGRDYEQTMQKAASVEGEALEILERVKSSISKLGELNPQMAAKLASAIFLTCLTAPPRATVSWPNSWWNKPKTFPS